MAEAEVEKVVIIGSGPAGHTAAIYAARANLEPLMFEGFMAGGVSAGGQITGAITIENYPGFPEGISGASLTDSIRAQSARYGTRIVTETVEAVNLSKRPFRVHTSEREVPTSTLIVATGAAPRRLDAPGVELYWGMGVSAYATDDGSLPTFRNKVLAVVGGGDSAAEQAIYLSRFGSRIILIHRRDSLRASKVMQERLLANPRVSILWETVVEEVLGDGQRMHNLRVRNLKSGTASIVEASGLFYAIGHTPNSAFLKGQVATDETGYILTRPGTTQTTVPGVFAAGDVQDNKWRQAITAAGTGCMAALEAERFLAEHGA